MRAPVPPRPSDPRPRVGPVTSPTHGPGRATPDRADVIDKGLSRVNVWGIRLIVGKDANYTLGSLVTCPYEICANTFRVNP